MAASGERAREHTIDLGDGRTLGYAEFGEPGGTPIVFVHGLPDATLTVFERLGHVVMSRFGEVATALIG